MVVLALPYRDSGNPYTQLLYDAMAAEHDVRVEDLRLATAWTQRPDVVHLHWPELVLATRWWLVAVSKCVLLLMTLVLHRWRGASIVWTVHNLRSHEGRYPITERLFRWGLRRVVTGLSHLTPVSERTLRGTVSPRTASSVIPHGDYRGAYPEPPRREEARGRLGYHDDDHVILGFGYLKPYKRFDLLMETFQELDGDDVHLLIAGAPYDERTVERLGGIAAADDRTALWAERLSEREVAEVFAAADLVVLPYSEILNSGVALLALSFDRPVLGPRRGALVHLEERVDGDWIMLFEPPLTSDDVAEALRWASDGRPRRNATANIPSWAEIARWTMDLYERSRPR